MRRNKKKERILIPYIYSFRGLHNVRPHPDWSLFGVKFKISDEHPRPFHMGVPPPPPGAERADEAHKSEPARAETDWDGRRNTLSMTLTANFVNLRVCLSFVFACFCFWFSVAYLHIRLFTFRQIIFLLLK